MKLNRFSLVVFAAAACAAQPAYANGTAAMAFPIVAPIWANAAAISCSPQTASPATSLTTQSKASAILGGTESALERMRREQAGLAAPAPTVAVPAAASSTPCLAMAKGIAAPQALSSPGASHLAAPVPAPFRRDEFLATRLLKIGKTPFDRQWARVEASGLSRNRVQRLVGAQDGRSEASLSAVNSYINRQIRYRDDHETAASGDYWQSASETLRRGTGDCEDYAIVKYQMLRGLGFKAEDLYLTLARDLVRNVDHAVLVVRLGDRHIMLDDATDTLLDASEARDYRAIFSYAKGRSFMHGIPNGRISG